MNRSEGVSTSKDFQAGDNDDLAMNFMQGLHVQISAGVVFVFLALLQSIDDPLKTTRLEVDSCRKPGLMIGSHRFTSRVDAKSATS